MSLPSHTNFPSLPVKRKPAETRLFLDLGRTILVVERVRVGENGGWFIFV